MSAPGNVQRSPATRDNWETPPDLFEKLNAEFRFTLDAAADEANRKCERWLEGPCMYSAPCTCGLCSDWLDNVVWCNPPYGIGLMAWAQKFAFAAGGGATVVALLPAATDTVWFDAVWQGATEIRLLRGRVQFVGTTSSNPSGSLIAIYRPGYYPIRNPHVTLWNWR